MIVICKKPCKIQTRDEQSCCGAEFHEFEIGEFYEVATKYQKLHIGNSVNGWFLETTVEFLEENFEELKIWQ